MSQLIRKISVFSFVASVALGVTVYHLKTRVRTLDEELDTTRSEMEATTDSLHVLKAEWGYLNTPGRLKTLNARCLGMQPVPPQRMTTIRTSDDSTRWQHLKHPILAKDTNTDSPIKTQNNRRS